MTYDEWAAIGHANGWLGSRRTDPVTSRSATATLKADSQRARLLYAYLRHGDLTDEQAGQVTGLSARRSCCYWKRCSELRQAGYIATTGVTRLSSAGEWQQVCRITGQGIDALDQITTAA